MSTAMTKPTFFHLDSEDPDTAADRAIEGMRNEIRARLDRGEPVELAVWTPVEMLTTSEAASHLGVSRQFLTRLLESGRIESVRLEDSTHRRVPLGALIAFAAERDRKRQLTSQLSKAMDEFEDID